ncbi:pyridoxal phosphate-dependent decarboxylase family protein [Sphingomonas qomolangmaensis]|uniref:Pyridoxal-dependent decarboxylase n=1 Tax=Sphingomonas qomolangmaensis TaxID=2918765 RepID=A0ABY5L935_9SPHN|nr:pyridoxal-dependent decarboxylase [Sphingomonas qomolangmaensis]UUL82309.1 pyridoxal-dependent decarboxylase [Sphingomonas qomolangmaensis]
MSAQDRTLDPQDWEAFRTLARRMVDDMVDHLATLAEQPAWQPMPERVLHSFDAAAPQEGIGEEAVYQRFLEDVLPYPNGNLHPRFFGWVQGNGTPLGMMADMLAAGMNPHMAGFNQAPVLVEEQTIRWMAELMDFPPGADGILVGGGSSANMLGLALARNEGIAADVRTTGVRGADRPVAIYASTETHGWIAKAAELLGLGRAACRAVAVGDDYRIDTDALKQAIARDRADGIDPICVIGTAGTVNTGATDDLPALAQICRDEKLWFHIDGAFGALAAWSPELKPIVAGLEQADSVAFDLHKWAYLPFTVACLLVRDGGVLTRSFASRAHYLAETDRGVAAGGMRFADRGVELTREFRALKLWMNLKAYGVRAFGDLILQNVEQARSLAGRVEAHAELELLAPVPLNIVCFRYCTGADRDDAFWNRVNGELLLRMQETGVAVPSSTVLDGRFAIRCCFVNHRTRASDIDLLVAAAVDIGRAVTAEMEG